MLCLSLISSIVFAHDKHDHAANNEAAPLPASQTAMNTEQLPKFTPQNWKNTSMIGIVPIMNTADLPRPFRDRTFVDTASLPGCQSREQVKLADPDMHFIQQTLVRDSSIRTSPFPDIMCFIDGTDYYQHRESLQTKFENTISSAPKDKQLIFIDNYVWQMIYLGEFKKVVSLLGPKGKYLSFMESSTEEMRGSLEFAAGQAYFRLGEYQTARPYVYRANKLLISSLLDTRWQYMLIDLALQGRQFLDLPNSEVYKKDSIRKIFPNRNWEKFPFEDVTDELGVERWGGTGSVSFVDLDGDGWDELVWERKFMPARVYKNLQGKKFKAIPDADLNSPSSTAIIFSAGDINNDGLPDLFRHCCNYDGHGPTQVLENKGNLKFEDITETSGLAYTKGSGMVVSWSDYDLDGHLDIVIADNYGPNRLYRNLGNGTYEDTTKKAGLEMSSTVGITFGDYDNDGWPDIWAQGWDAKWLYRNNKDGTFTEVSEAAGIAEHLGQKGYMSFMFDYNNDGHMDLFAGQYVVSSDEKWGFGPICSCSNLLSDEGYSEREWRSATTIFENNGDNTFTNISSKTNFIPLGMMGSNHADWNNDGYEDLFFGAGGPFFQQAEPFLFYQNNAGRSFTNITPFEMIGIFGKGHGSAFADINHDGFLDLATNNGGAAPGDLWPSMVLRNKGNNNNWLFINLKAGKKGTNALAVGARVTVYSGNLKITKELQSGGQFGATNSLAMHFGLAKNKNIEKIVIRWPNKSLEETVITNVKPNQSIEVSEVSGKYKKLWGK